MREVWRNQDRNEQREESGGDRKVRKAPGLLRKMRSASRAVCTSCLSGQRATCCPVPSPRSGHPSCSKGGGVFSRSMEA
jgi:hypothetical protein